MYALRRGLAPAGGILIILGILNPSLSQAVTPVCSADPTIAAEAKKPLGGQRPPLIGKLPKGHLDQNQILVDRRTPIPFTPFEMKDPDTGNKVLPGQIISLRNGRKVKAGDYYAELNGLEQDLNRIGHSLKDDTGRDPATCTRSVRLQITPTNETLLRQQQEMIAQQHRPPAAFQKPPVPRESIPLLDRQFLDEIKTMSGIGTRGVEGPPTAEEQVAFLKDRAQAADDLLQAQRLEGDRALGVEETGGAVTAEITESIPEETQKHEQEAVATRGAVSRPELDEKAFEQWRQWRKMLAAEATAPAESSEEVASRGFLSTSSTSYTPPPSASLSPAVTQAIAPASGGTYDGAVPPPGTPYTPPPSASLSPAVTQAIAPASGGTPYSPPPSASLSPAVIQTLTSPAPATSSEARKYLGGCGQYLPGRAPTLCGLTMPANPQPIHRVKDWNFQAGGDIFGAYLRGRATLDGYVSLLEVHGDAQAGGMVLGANATILEADGTVKVQQPDALTAYLTIKIVGSTVCCAPRTQNVAWGDANEYSQGVDRSTPPITIWIGPIPLSVQAGIRGNAGLKYTVGSTPVKAYASLGPYAELSGYAQAGLGFNLVLVEAFAGVRGTVTLISDALATVTSVKWTLVNGAPAFGYRFLVFNDLDMLSGAIDLVARIGYVCFNWRGWCVDEYTHNLFRWGGIHLTGYLASEEDTQLM